MATSDEDVMNKISEEMAQYYNKNFAKFGPMGKMASDSNAVKEDAAKAGVLGSGMGSIMGTGQAAAQAAAAAAPAAGSAVARSAGACRGGGRDGGGGRDDARGDGGARARRAAR